jgi:hypothetical protein
MHDSKEIFFHVGLPKAASTFLQRNVFTKFKNLHFIKKHDFKRHQQIIESSDADKILLSIELNINVESGRTKMESVARNYPGSKPILVLRKHSSWVKSKYKYYLRKHGEADFNNYFDISDHHGILPAKELHFFEKIKLLEQEYQTRPLVLFQKELINNPSGFIDAIAAFVGAEYDLNEIKLNTVKKSYNDKQLYYVRRFNRSYHFDENKGKGVGRKMNKLYKKLSALYLHSVAFGGALMPYPRQLKEQPLIDKETLKRVDEMFSDDWNKCLQYARKDRELFME